MPPMSTYFITAKFLSLWHSTRNALPKAPYPSNLIFL